MPELPEVETTLRGIAPSLEGRRLTGAVVRQARLRYPVPSDLADHVRGKRIRSIQRRAKYLVFDLGEEALLVHLGMSGSLRMVPRDAPPGPHDHFDLVAGRECLRLRDPRRFGLVLLHPQPVREHPLLAHLGPEPLGREFDGDYLYDESRGRTLAVKNFIMNSQVVVGVGNIYASESLFLAGIHPARAAGRISRARYDRLENAIRNRLVAAIEQGGTTLRDFVREDGRPGYFTQQLAVYGRDGEPCPACGRAIALRVIGQRSSYFCSRCQR
ncbi:MAG: bifunctional DNA-formamidopyrimidine glycosylase/DNA-(apurinic or apyrimidinic site) lyase [Pseudomonadota bacterium]